jgi:serine/threonine protein kinase
MFEYEIMKKLGQGAFGTSYLIQDKEYKRYVLKKIPLRKVDFTEIDTEINILKRLSKTGCQKGLLCYMEHFIDYEENTINIVTDYFQGITLTDFIGELKMDRVYLKRQTLLNIMKNLMESLELLHKKQMAHGDLKPGNILINPITYETQIIDFGTSCYKKCIPSGTLLYASKEKLELMGNVNKISVKKIQQDDIFGMGLVLYYLANLEMPYTIQTNQIADDDSDSDSDSDSDVDVDDVPKPIVNPKKLSIQIPDTSDLQNYRRKYSPEIVTDNDLLATKTLLDFYKKRGNTIFSNYGDSNNNTDKVINEVIENALNPVMKRFSAKRLLKILKNLI